MVQKAGHGKPSQILYVVQTGLGPGRLGLPAQAPAGHAYLGREHSLFMATRGQSNQGGENI